MKKPAYRLNDAPRRWWNILDSALRSYGLVQPGQTVVHMYTTASRSRSPHW